MKHFIDPEMLAPNVLTVAVDPAIVGEFTAIARDHGNPERFDVEHPPWNSDVRWISANSEETFALFQSAFDRLGVAAHVEPYLDLDRAVRLYCGFLVVRSHCSTPDFHRDWDGADNEAFTLITPVTANASEFGLLYQRLDGSIGEYRYKVGEALILGDHFVHSTKPGLSDEPVVLLSFTFGTDRMAHWDRIARTAGYQSRLLQLPDGSFRRRS